MSDRKTLLPELLPAPTSESRPGSTAAPPPSPVERVAEQARLMLGRFRTLGPVAGATMLGLHGCGYTVVDPLPPPPAQCTTLPMPFERIGATLSTAIAVDGGVSSVILTLSSGGYSGVLGFRVDAVRVTGATLVGQTSTMPNGPSGGVQFEITIAPQDDTSTFLVDVDLGCGAATTTKHYRVTYLMTGHPALEELPGA
jgi:hypothetical protein